MSRSIHMTVSECVRRNRKSELTADNPDLQQLAKKRLYKQTTQLARTRRKPHSAANDNSHAHPTAQDGV